MTSASALSRRWRLAVLGICSFSLFMNYIDSTALNVALPTLARELHAGVASLQWVVDAYMLVLASLLLAAGSAADRLGRRRVFSIGLLTFSAGSLLCSLAPNVASLIAFRALQALGGCMLTPVSLSIVRNVFTDPAERARAMGVWSAVFGLATACGPIVGGLIVSGFGWRAIFWVNVPVGLTAFVLTRLFVPESRSPRPRPLDLSGQLLVIVLLASLTGAIIEGPVRGWSSPLIAGAFACAAVAAVALVAVELRRAEPLLEVRFFRSRPFAGATAVGVASFTVLSGFLFVNTLDLQLARGDSALAAGVALLPATAAIPVAAVISGRVLARRGPTGVMAAGGALLVAAMGVLARLGPGPGRGTLAGAYVLLGLGMGLVSPPVTNIGVNAMPPSQAGVASAVTSVSRQLGNLFGVAAFGALFASSLRSGLPAGLASAGLTPAGRAARLSGAGVGLAGAHAAVAGALRDAITGATHAPYVFGAACGAACVLLAVSLTGRRAHAAASRRQRDPALSGAAGPPGP